MHLGPLSPRVWNSPEMQAKVASRSYMHWAIVAPGDVPMSVGYGQARTATGVNLEGSVIHVRAQTAVQWHVWAHEFGHNLGLDHSGGYLMAGGGYQPYQDEEIMGFNRFQRADFNAVKRYMLGWMPDAQARARRPP